MPLTEYRHTDSIVVARSAEHVFDFVADSLNDPKWCADVSDYERLEDGDSGLPAYSFVQHFRDQKHAERLEVTELSRPSRYRSRMTVMDASVEALIELSAEGPGTRVAHTNRITMPWSLVWQRPIRQRVTKRIMRTQLEALKFLLGACVRDRRPAHD